MNPGACGRVQPRGRSTRPLSPPSATACASVRARRNGLCPVQQAPHRLRTDPQGLGDLHLPAAPGEETERGEFVIGQQSFCRTGQDRPVDVPVLGLHADIGVAQPVGEFLGHGHRPVPAAASLAYSELLPNINRSRVVCSSPRQAGLGTCDRALHLSNEHWTCRAGYSSWRAGWTSSRLSGWGHRRRERWTERVWHGGHTSTMITS